VTNLVQVVHLDRELGGDLPRFETHVKNSK
jgi:hypothetical protein